MMLGPVFFAARSEEEKKATSLARDLHGTVVRFCVILGVEVGS